MSILQKLMERLSGLCFWLMIAAPVIVMIFGKNAPGSGGFVSKKVIISVVTLVGFMFLFLIFKIISSLLEPRKEKQT